MLVNSCPIDYPKRKKSTDRRTASGCRHDLSLLRCKSKTPKRRPKATGGPGKSTWQRSLNCLLLDEPFSHIDNFRKNNSTQESFFLILERKKHCLCWLPHMTAPTRLSFADNILVMQSGKIRSRRHSPERHCTTRRLPSTSLHFLEM